MKMVKSLLLGSAAGVVAIAGAQAADLPVKAKPVQYVKICSLYGAGFYYIPGTDFCLKLGGWVRTEYNMNSHGSFSPILSGGDARYTRESNDNTWRTRYILTVDVRNQTEYGTLRTYIASGVTTSNGNNADAQLYNNRAFIQWAGFTMGLASSFFDFFQFSSVSNQTNVIGSDTGGNGLMVWAYTAQLGNGLSATISLEDPTHPYRTKGIGESSAAVIGATGALTNHTAGSVRWPDVVGNLRIDQSWGSAQIMAAAHDVMADYYVGSPVTAGTTEWNGHPGDEVGWAVGGGIKVNLPWGKGDFVALQAAYSKGALGYIGSGFGSGGFAIFSGGTVGYGPIMDAVYDSNNFSGSLSGLELTEGWEIGGGLQHNWNSMWKTSIYGAYTEINYGSAATAYLNQGQGFTQGTSWNSSFWQIGSRTVWTPTKGLDLSVDVMYNHLNTAWSNIPGGAVVVGPGGGKVTTTYALTDQDVWQGIFRVQRNFYP
jgi:Porin subfamily